ncbi:MAG: hypothetical protein DRQ48_02915 [Gammaproteobacteria bacterium]|nr:MAG: hypothetical protein DRQ58_03710 [Gammaproteobacteria bacterium]RKZ71650.1 MAG: hypothetical protein DRQ48_02915 [Gammaproteobacteria bacterium]
MYNIFDISIESDLRLPELSEGVARETVIKIKSGADSKRAHCEPEHLHEWKDTDGEICMLSAKFEDNYLLRFPGLVDFLICSSGESVFYFPESDIPEETIRHLILDQLIPRILGQRGHLVLHASAVQIIDEKAVVFLGATGWGKSTIASSYYENGAQLITDDCLLIKIIENKVFCVPNYCGLRLYPDSAEAIFKDKMQYEPVAHYTSKERLILHHVEPEKAEPIPVSAIFLLSDPDIGSVDTVSIKKIQGAKEIMAIVEQTFLMDIEDKATISKQFTNASVLNEVSPVLYGLSYPRKYEMLAEVRNTVEMTAANII